MNTDDRDCRQKSTCALPPGAFYRLPVLVLVFAYTAGIIPGRFLLFSTPVRVIIWTALAASVIRVIYLLLKNRPACISPMVLFFTLGLVAVTPWKPDFFPSGKAALFLDSDRIQIRGTLAEPAQKDPRRTLCILEDLEISDASNDNPVSAAGKLKLSIYDSTPDLLPGDRIFLQAGIRSFKNFNNPGGFDYRQYMADQNIWGNVYARSSDIEKLPQNTPKASMLQHSIHRFREHLDAAISKSANQETAAVLSALIVGKRHGIDHDLRESFNRAGASHLLAISGLHVGIVATCAFLIFKLIFSCSRTLLLNGLAVRAAALLSLLPVAAYVMISGFSPSTQRAGIMVAIFLLAFILEKPYHPANTLAVAALLILGLYPPGLFSISFQLSFTAVAAIFFGLYLFSGTFIFSPDYQSRETVQRFMKRLLGFAMISVFAIAGTMPLVMHYFNQAAITGMVSNLILIPWIGFAVVPAGLISALAFALSEPAGIWCLTAAGRMLDPALHLIHALADLRFGAFKTVTPGILELICVYLLFILIGLAATPRLKQHRKTIIVTLCLVASVAAADAGYWVHRRFLNQDLRITVLDVGHGFSSLVEFPKGRTMLIDGGGFSDNAVFDVGRLIVAPYLWKNKIGKIDTVILSHPDADHLNGLLYILENFRIGKVVTGPSDAETIAWQRFVEIIEEKDILHPEFEDIESSRINGAEFDILYPDTNTENPNTHCSVATNNCSLVVKVHYNGKSVLFPGDIEKSAESVIVSKAASRAASDILIAPHHGSKTSSSSKFLETVDPATVIISARKSGFRAPSKEVLNRYDKMGCRILRTDKKGAVTIRIKQEGEMIIEPVISRKQGT
ncbi:MAG: DNA internalization-related competence protein ComEC/Rec2 [Desulfobacterales bacterium]